MAMSRKRTPIAALHAKIRAIRLIVFDFDGVFTDNAVYVFQDGSEAVRCSRADGIGLRKLERAGIAALILSTELNPVVSARARKLELRCEQGCKDKLKRLTEIIGELELDWRQVAFVGNDVNDLECLQRVGLPIIVRDAHPDVFATAYYRTTKPGGQGAVREVCDLFARALRGKKRDARGAK